MKRKEDAYGQEIWSCHWGVTDYEIVERDDGFIDLGSARLYFLSHADWPVHEREAIRHAHGWVLDIGCGAGRASLYLQQQGLRVLAIDNSPVAIKVSQLRGVQSARVLPIQEIGKLKGPFDTFVMYGNNFGLFGGLRSARRLLATMHRISTPDATILASTFDPYTTTDALHLRYHRRNRARGRMGGQIRFRIRYQQFCGEWFDYLFASKDEVRAIVEGTGWELRETVDSTGPAYVAILKKSV